MIRLRAIEVYDINSHVGITQGGILLIYPASIPQIGLEYHDSRFPATTVNCQGVFSQKR